VKEYEIVIKLNDTELTFQTDKRKLARAAKELALENGGECAVTRTAKKDVKFANL